MTRDQLVAVRQTEQRNAAEAVGVTSCTFLDGEDGELEYTREMLGKIVREIRRLKPYAVFTHTPEIFHRRSFARPGEDERYAGFINHRDHRNAGVMAVDAVYPTARDHLNFPEHIEEGLETHRVREVYIWDGNDPNYDVDVTAVIDRKIEALRRHVSQFGDRGDGFIDQLKSRWRDPDGRFHERFLRVVLPG